ncbi:hypothetical protein BE20_23560 [Sorangium cellulosum]|nr:hypothetical protein BE20_23560 [Sorangium cellulosum]
MAELPAPGAHVALLGDEAGPSGALARVSPIRRAASSSAATALLAVSGRSPARFSSIASTGRSSSRGRSGHTLDIRGGGCKTWLYITATADPPANRYFPVSILWIITPSA